MIRCMEIGVYIPAGWRRLLGTLWVRASHARCYGEIVLKGRKDLVSHAHENGDARSRGSPELSFCVLMLSRKLTPIIIRSA